MASFCAPLYHNSSWYLSLDRQARFLPDTLLMSGSYADIKSRSRYGILTLDRKLLTEGTFCQESKQAVAIL